ncbi:uncharacterized protein LOC133081953 [Eubalaena glacialis]|uniref:uncharacterized protein LOC133081952 n=1 Tax=Eubalaena glacialis TaxID=27606 RepID=UPI002A5A26EE|nr:uncharacterized protein LOC133081952 [Eubalaena glacialis]XP_061034243.1 uncharacterized protein LOC133081953 [Eubalaena glacialis]
MGWEEEEGGGCGYERSTGGVLLCNRLTLAELREVLRPLGHFRVTSCELNSFRIQVHTKSTQAGLRVYTLDHSRDSARTVPALLVGTPRGRSRPSRPSRRRRKNRAGAEPRGARKGASFDWATEVPVTPEGPGFLGAGLVTSRAWDVRRPARGRSGRGSTRRDDAPALWSPPTFPGLRPPPPLVPGPGQSPRSPSPRGGLRLLPGRGRGEASTESRPLETSGAPSGAPPAAPGRIPRTVLRASGARDGQGQCIGGPQGPAPLSVIRPVLCEARILPAPHTRGIQGEVWPAGKESCPSTPVLQDNLWLQPSAISACLPASHLGGQALSSRRLSCQTFLTKRVSQLLGDAAQTCSTPSATTHRFGQSLRWRVFVRLQDGPPSSWSLRANAVPVTSHDVCPEPAALGPQHPSTFWLWDQMGG